MNFFDTVIDQTQACLAPYTPRIYLGNPARTARETGKNQLILGSEAAYELGALSCDSVSTLLVTESETAVPQDEILVYGPDLADIRQDCSFARIAILRTDNIAQNGEQAAFAILREIETRKYGVYPEGYMIRAAAFSNREQARVSKKALKAGLNFEQIGNLFIRQYKQNRHVQAVKLMFVTLPEAPYGELDTLATKAQAITKALDHILDDVNMDCNACEWKVVCDEVEGMKEMHGKIRRRGH